jgi:hypothetical protein
VEEGQLPVPFDELRLFGRRGDDEAFQAEKGQNGDDDDPVDAHDMLT